MKQIILLSIFPLFLFSCANPPADHNSVAEIKGSGETKVLEHPEWSRNATIYEVNIRQHTPEGTFAAFEKDLSRLNQMGVKIIWLMPIHPIGVENRKGNLGSYYSVKDYKGINPSYGSLDDFKRLVRTAHSLDMKVIIDWVANHSAFDNHWVAEHPEYYLLDTAGQVQPPLGTDWTDVAQLDYNRKAIWHAMIDAMKYWVKECDVDGFRCDVADKVPTPFWEEARASLDSIKPVFMLAEAELPELHLKAFDMTYAWEFMHLANDLAQGKRVLSDIDSYLAKQDTLFPRSAYRMYFTTNHDENSWQGTAFERHGNMRQLMEVLAYTIDGMPLIYSGQEGGEQSPDGIAHRYEFFTKDTIHFNDYKYQDFYSRLLFLHRNNPAMWNGEYSGEFKRLKTSNDDVLYCFSRKKDDNEVIVMLNFSDKPRGVDFVGKIPEGDYLSIFDTRSLTLYTKGNQELPAYGYQVLVKGGNK